MPSVGASLFWIVTCAVVASAPGILIAFILLFPLGATLLASTPEPAADTAGQARGGDTTPGSRP
jgi:hypothetical protein